MGRLVPYRPPQAHGEWTAFVGMVIFLGSWGMMFGSLFFAYGVVRAHSPFWPPPDLPELPLVLPVANTLALALSSGTLQWGLVSVRRGRPEALVPATAATLALGAFFLGSQLYVWKQLYDEGLRVSAGPYPSVFYGLTCFHALHVAVGLGALAVILRRSLQSRYSAARHLPVRLWALYWHFVGVVWAIMFVTVYLV
jgi:cytochrome c oxidase subunit 3